MAHALRHFYGSNLALRGVPGPVNQQLLGHADSCTTSIYTAAHGTDLAQALRAAGLLSRASDAYPPSRSSRVARTLISARSAQQLALPTAGGRGP